MPDTGHWLFEGVSNKSPASLEVFIFCLLLLGTSHNTNSKTLENKPKQIADSRQQCQMYYNFAKKSYRDACQNQFLIA